MQQNKNLLKYLKKNTYYDPNARPLYFEYNFENVGDFIKAKDIETKDLRFYVNTLKVLENFETDDICDLFNALNWGKKITLKNLSEEARLLYSKSKTYKYAHNYIFIKKNKFYNDFFSEKGWQLFHAFYFYENSDFDYLADNNTCNYDNMLDLNFVFTEGLKINDKWYSLIALHNGGDLRGNYLPFIMILNKGGMFCELGRGLYHFSLSFTRNDKLILSDNVDPNKIGTDNMLYTKEEEMESMYKWLDDNYIDFRLIPIQGDCYIIDNEFEGYIRFSKFPDIYWSKYYDKNLDDICFYKDY